MLGEVMLYRPVNKEIEEAEIEPYYDEMYQDERRVNMVKSQVMKHLEGVEEARYYVEQAKKELDQTEVGKQMDPTLEQDNADCEAEEVEGHPDFIHIDPDQIEVADTSSPTSIYRRI